MRNNWSDSPEAISMFHDACRARLNAKTLNKKFRQQGLPHRVSQAHFDAHSSVVKRIDRLKVDYPTEAEKIEKIMRENRIHRGVDVSMVREALSRGLF